MTLRIKPTLILIALLASFVSLPAQDQAGDGAYSLMLKTLLAHSVPEVSADSMAAMLDHVVLLDAREPYEYQVSHIADAYYVGFENFSAEALLDIDRNQPIIVYCSVGYRSEKIAERLIAEGYSQVYNLYGGIFEWKNAGYPVRDKYGQTERVHAYSRSWGIWLESGEKVYD